MAKKSKLKLKDTIPFDLNTEEGIDKAKEWWEGLLNQYRYREKHKPGRPDKKYGKELLVVEQIIWKAIKRLEGRKIIEKNQLRMINSDDPDIWVRITHFGN